MAHAVEIRGPFEEKINRTRSRTVKFEQWTLIGTRTRNTSGEREISIRIIDDRQGHESTLIFNGADDRYGDNYEQLARHVSDLLDLVSADPCLVDQSIGDLDVVR